jgi:outer membrane protein
MTRIYQTIVTCCLCVAAAAARAEDPPPTSAPVPVVLPVGGRAPDRGVPRVTLQKAIQRALAHNPSLALARADIARAEALVRQARAPSLPTLAGTFTFTRLDDDRVFGTGATARVVAYANQSYGNLVLSVPLVHTQRWVQWRRSRDNVETTRISAEEVRRQVAAAVARSYLACLAQHRVIEINERARDTAREHLAFARRRFTGGAGNRLDAVRAAQDMATTESQVQVAYGNLAKVREALGVLLGEDKPVDVADEWTLGQPPSVRDAVDSLRTRRADVRALDLKLDVAKRSVRDSWTDYMPYLTGVFQPFFQDPASMTTPQGGWQAQLILTIPFYDGGLRYGQARERKAMVSTAQATLEASLRQARSEIRTAFAVMRQADKALTAAREAAQLSQEAYKMANTAYEAGATTSLEVIDAARRSRDAESAAVVAEDNARQARLDLFISSGRLP